MRFLLIAAVAFCTAGVCAQSVFAVAEVNSESKQQSNSAVSRENRRTLADHSAQPIRARRWSVTDIQFAVEAVPSQPVDVRFSAHFEHESGRKMVVPGFYNGGKKYTIRFAPPMAGAWTYRTNSDFQALAELNGTVSAALAGPGRHGGIEIDSQQKTRFRYADGTSYYPIAFECDWLFALDADNADDIPNTRTFIDSLAKNGFNQIVMNVFAFDVNWKKDASLDPKYDYGSPDAFPFGGTNAAPDHSRIHVDYFRRLDRVIDYLDEKGIAAHLMIYVWNKRVNWPAANSADDNRYFDYVVKRYQAYPNLVWDISKEALGYGHNDVNYITNRIDRLRKQDAYNRLVTVHDYGYCRRFPQHVDFVSVQLWLSELYSVMRNVRANIPGKPILNIEHGGYERSPWVVFTGNYTSPDVCLERAWQCVFAGTYPTHYWQGAAWNVIVPDIEALPEKQRPRFEYYRHMHQFVTRYKFDELKAGDKKSNAGFSLHNGKDLYVYYVPKECEFIGVRLPKDLRDRFMTATWFNPFDGTESEPVKKKITQWPAFQMPEGDGFRILVVRILDSEAKPAKAPRAKKEPRK